MPEKMPLNSEENQQMKIADNKSEEKTSDVLDVAKDQKSEEVWELKQKLERGIQEGSLLKSAMEQKGVILTTEQEKKLQSIRQELAEGNTSVYMDKSRRSLPIVDEIKKLPVGILDSFPDIKKNLVIKIINNFNGPSWSSETADFIIESGLVKLEDYKELLIKKIIEVITTNRQHSFYDSSSALSKYINELSDKYSLKRGDFLKNAEIQNHVIEIIKSEARCNTFQSTLDAIEEFQLLEKTLPEIDSVIFEKIIQDNDRRNINIENFIPLLDNEKVRKLFPRTIRKISEMVFDQLGKDKELTNLFIENLSKNYQQPEMLKKIIVKLLENKDLSSILRINDACSISAEIISDPEIKKTIFEEISNNFLEDFHNRIYDRRYYYNDNEKMEACISVSELFNLSSEIFSNSTIRNEAKKALLAYLAEGDTDNANYIKEKFNIIFTPQELIAQDSEVEVLLLKLKEISPEFYDQALKSVDIIISLFPLAKNLEQTIETIKNNPFLIDAVSENSRFGSKLLVKYPEFDETSRENIKFMYNAKKEILEENPQIDPESLDFRIAIQEKLKTYKDNPEILKQIEARGIDIGQWLNYSETEYFSLDSGNSKLAFSETVATPINRIKETIASYSYRVKEIIKEYQKELKEFKIQAGNVDETSELIKKMESELAKAKREGNEAKVKGIEKGIASYQEKMKKGKEIPLWDKVIGDINSFDRLKNDVFLSHEKVIKAEEEFKERAQDKSRAAMDIMEAKRILAKAKEDLKEKFGLLEKRTEDFRNNFVSVLAPALGKDKAESLLQEIQEGLGEQFNHYDTDRSTLANLFSERSDKEKEKLDSRPMSIFVGARNPDVDLYQGNYSSCCICIDSAHMGAESTIADYNTDLGIQIVNIWDETKNEPITAAWCWIGKDKNGNAALVVDNIESNTLYSANYSELLTEKLFEYLENYAKSIGIKKVVQGKANNDLPAASQLAKMDSDNKEYQKVGGCNRENGYFLEAEETGTKIIWEEKEKKKKKREKSEKTKTEFQNREFRSLTKEDLEDVLKLEEIAYENDYLNQGEELAEDIESGKGFNYSVVLTGEKEADKKEIIGYAVGVEDETDEGKPSVYLEDIVIAPEAQGQGFGWEIIEKMIEKLKEKAAKENKTILFDMHLRESSQRLMEKHKEDLERLGLKLVDEALVPDYYDEGEDALYQVYEIGE